MSGRALVTVHVRTDQSFHRALQTFMREVDHTGILRELKTHEHFVSKSERRRIRERRSAFRREKALLKKAQKYRWKI